MELNEKREEENGEQTAAAAAAARIGRGGRESQARLGRDWDSIGALQIHSRVPEVGFGKRECGRLELTGAKLGVTVAER
jgi:hypothetical protein